MPAIYAHHRLGTEVFRSLHGDLRNILLRYHTQFEIGLQGPDIFFFYQAWRRNPVTDFGNLLHSRSAMPFMENALRVMRKTGRQSSTYAYMMGFICHFALDSECHRYVAEMIEKKNVPHLEIEEEFDKLLMRRDGKDPFTFPVADMIPTDRATAKAIFPLFDSPAVSDPRVVQQALRDMKRLRQALTTPNRRKQRALNFLMRRIVRWQDVTGMMNQLTDDPRCRESNAGLWKRYQRAVDVAVTLIKDFDTCLLTGKSLSSRFDRNFEGH